MTSQIIKMIIIATMTSLVLCTHNFRSCDPENPITCGFGAKCDKVSNAGEDYFYFLLLGFTTKDYVCTCDINGYNKPRRLLCDPVKNVTYYNEHRIKEAECKQQGAIVANCEGPCGECIPIKHTGWRRCTIGIVNHCFEDEICYEREDSIADYICKK